MSSRETCASVSLLSREAGASKCGAALCQMRLVSLVPRSSVSMKGLLPSGDAPEPATTKETVLKHLRSAGRTPRCYGEWYDDRTMTSVPMMCSICSYLLWCQVAVQERRPALET